MAKGQKYHCGPVNYPKWVRRIASYKFNASCYIHDKDFSSNSPYTKEEADERFLIHMVRQADNSLFWHIVAVIMYWAVKKYGDKHFEGNLNK